MLQLFFWQHLLLLVCVQRLPQIYRDIFFTLCNWFYLQHHLEGETVDLAKKIELLEVSKRSSLF